MPHWVVCAVCIAVVVGMLVFRYLHMDNLIVAWVIVHLRVECIIANRPTVVGAVDKESALLLAGCDMKGVASINGCDAARLALHIVGVAACLVREAEPGRTERDVVVLRAGREEK